MTANHQDPTNASPPLDPNPLNRIPTTNSPAVPNPEQTFGQRMVRCTFNPSGLKQVDMIKATHAEMIDFLNQLRNQAKSDEERRCYSISITHLETSCMYAVKGFTS
jgi:hypothetical protein